MYYSTSSLISNIQIENSIRKCNELSLDDNIRNPQSLTYLRESLMFNVLTTRKDVFKCLKQVNIYFSMSNIWDLICLSKRQYRI